MRLVAVALPLVALLGACAEQQDPSNGAHETAGTTVDDPRYEATTTVLEDADGPQLCLGGVMESLPPQCGGIPVEGWNWADVDGEESVRGVTWGEFHVVGTFDGRRFTLLGAGPPKPAPVDDGDGIVAPCPEPPGGWVDVDPSMTGENDRIAAARAAEDISAFAGVWISYLEQPVDPEAPGDVVVTIGFTGDPSPHEAAIRQVWGGPLCLTSMQHTFAELRRAQRDLGEGGAAQLGLEMTWSDIDVMANRVELGVVVFDPALQSAVDEEYGAGAVHVEPALRPVGG
jgi:hypothetical protein